jgi:hypothetical protein
MNPAPSAAYLHAPEYQDKQKETLINESSKGQHKVMKGI